MHHFNYVSKELYCEEVPVTLIAQEVGTPFYLYSYATLRQHFHAFDGAFKDIDHITCFSMKSNSNLAVVRLMAQEGGGADIVSGGELYRALKAGVDPKKIVFSGVGKGDDELNFALSTGILMFNTESEQEIERLDFLAEKHGIKAPVSIRVNPDVDPKTHPYVSTGLRKNKFGIDMANALEAYKMAASLPNLKILGISCHIGSQLTEVSPFVDSLKRLLYLVDQLNSLGIETKYLDLGGGLGITYENEWPPHPEEYARPIKEELASRNLTLILEPGRVITGNAGILVTKVLYRKSSREKTFLIVDAAMNDLIRPSLYNSYHAIQPVIRTGRGKIKTDIVGPVCESGDFLAKDRMVEIAEPGELLAVMSAGAYGFTMSSNYNSRPRAAEVMVKDDKFYVVRERETYEDLIRGERIPDFMTG